MNPINHLCDAIQQEISTSLDEGKLLSAELTSHVEGCENCAEFIEFSTSGIIAILAEPLPPAGIALRGQILSLPQTARAPNSVSRPAPPSARRGRSIISSLAAALVLGCCGYWMVEIHPAGYASSSYLAEMLPTHKLAMAEELVALEKDFQSGVAELRGPFHSIQEVLNR